MATLSRHSSLVQVEAEYMDCASYAEDGDVDKAKRFSTACRFLILMRPAETGSRESHLKLSPELLQKQIEEARQWLDANGAPSAGAPGDGTRITRVSFENFR